MSGDVRDPWWSSGSGPDEGLAADEDPLGRHLHSRGAGGDVGGGVGGGDGSPRPGGHERDAHGTGDRGWDVAGDVPGGGAAGDLPPHVHGSDGEVCQICPICVALRALDRSRPELVAHLSEAMRHLALAARAFVDAQTATPRTGDDRLRRIDLEDE